MHIHIDNWIERGSTFERQVLRIGPSGPNHHWWVTKTASASRHISSESRLEVRGKMESQIWSVGKRDKYVVCSMVTYYCLSWIEQNKTSAKMFGASFTGTYLHPFLLSPIQPHLTPSPCEDLRRDRGRSAPLKECPQKKPVFLHSCLLAPIYLLPPLSCKAGAKSFYSGVAIHNTWICQI